MSENSKIYNLKEMLLDAGKKLELENRMRTLRNQGVNVLKS